MFQRLQQQIRIAAKNWLLRNESLRRPAARYCIDNGLLPSILVWTPSEQVRQFLHLPQSEFVTQLNQDVFALLANRYRPGFFLDIGANDGFELSNTAYLEKHFGWRGLLVEANSKYSESLKKRTRSQVVIKAISREAGTADFVDGGLYGGLVDAMDMTHQDRLSAAPQIQVECITLGELLAEYDSPHRIDFVSIDVEGAELPIVEQLVKVDRRFTCGCIEYNARVSDYAKMKCLLEGAGYRVCWEGQTGHDLFFIEESHAQLVY